MKIKKVLGGFLITFITMLIFSVNVVALASFPKSFTTNSQTSGGITINWNNPNELFTSATCENNTNLKYPCFFAKNSDKGNVICVSGVGVTPPGASVEYETTAWGDDKHSRGVAYIINEVIGVGGNASVTKEQYYWTEILINTYLGTESFNENQYMYIYYIEPKKTIPGTGTDFNSIIAAAKTYAQADYTVSLSATSGYDNLTFTKSNDGYYYSNPITITSNTNYKLSSNTNSKFSYEKEGNEYVFKIKESDIKPGSSESFSITVTNTGKEYYTAQRYKTDTNYQDLTLSQTVKNTVDAKSLTIKGAVTAPAKGKLIINKVDENGKPVIGATILVTSRTSDNFKKTFVTDGNPIILDNLVLGKYSVDEEIAPAGYLKAEGQIVNFTESNLEETVNLVDKAIKLSILKVNDQGKGLAGAKLQLLDKDGKVVEICGDVHNDKCEWVSTDKAYNITLIPAGTYYLKEISVPKGYSINPNKIKVEISAHGEVKVDGKTVKGTTVKVLNSLTRTEISKINAVNSKELPGATLQILNKEKESMSCLIINEDGKEETIKPCKWISGKDPKIVLGLAEGTYYLEELIAPEGYELNKNRVEFKVKSDGDVTKVEMKNELIVEVPDTLSARSALLIAISMFDIALGIGIITYVKKNKVEE